MDGRDLLKEIYPGWTPKSGFKSILEGILPFLSKAINAKGYKFYGFHLGATYNLKKIDNMIVGKYKLYLIYIIIYNSYFGLLCGRK